MFAEAFHRFAPGELEGWLSAVIPLFGQFMNSVGRSVQVGLESAGDSPIAMLGNVGVKIGDGPKVEVLDFNDFPQPKLEPLRYPPDPFIESGEFGEHLERFEREGTFVTPLNFDVRTDAPI